MLLKYIFLETGLHPLHDGIHRLNSTWCARVMHARNIYTLVVIVFKMNAFKSTENGRRH